MKSIFLELYGAEFVKRHYFGRQNLPAVAAVATARSAQD